LTHRKLIPESHDLYKISRYVGDNLEEMKEARLILKDDLAPVEILGQKALNEIVDEEIQVFRSGLKGKSLKDIIEYLQE
jgi:hypothetical protein